MILLITQTFPTIKVIKLQFSRAQRSSQFQNHLDLVTYLLKNVTNFQYPIHTKRTTPQATTIRNLNTKQNKR